MLTKYRLDEIDKIKGYFNNEINERKAIVKKISKYIVVFDVADKILITLSALFGALSIASHATVVGIPAGIAGASLTLIFTVSTGIVKKLFGVVRKKKKKHNKILSLAKRKLNIIETLLSQALSDLAISHEEFELVINEKIKYEKIKENINTIKSNDIEMNEVNETKV